MLSENIAVSSNSASDARNWSLQVKGVRFMHTATDKLGNTAAYLREHDINSILADLGRAARKYPGTALIAAAAVGFLLGRTLTRNE